MNAMLTRISLAAALAALLAVSPAEAQLRGAANVMDRRVSLTLRQAPLESVLRTLRQQYGVRISYSKTTLDLSQPVTLNVQNQPLRAVLEELLRDKNIGYELIGDQVVLHTSPPAPKTPAPAPKNNPVSTPRASDQLPATESSLPSEEFSNQAVTQSGKVGIAEGEKSRSVTKKTKPAAPIKSKTTGAVPANKSQGARKTGSNKAPNQASDNGQKNTAATATSSSTAVESVIANKPATPGGTTAGEAPALTAPEPARDTTSLAAPDSVAATPPPGPENSVETVRPTYYRTAQVSFISPLGTNWLSSGRTVNRISVNVLGGYAAGVNGFEGAGLINVDRDSVRGVQLAGLVNLVGKRLDGFQYAGLANMVGGGGSGWQAAGLFNFDLHSIEGVQMAGLFNYAGPAENQQITPDFSNTQAAGLLNVAIGEVRGVQVAGLLNVARSVKGVQLAGLVNVADSVQGVSIAPLNLVRHGYHRLEISHSETWPVSLALKLGGSAAFYTYLTGAYELFGNTPQRWTVGFGAGAELAARRRFSLSLDVQSGQVNEDGNGWDNHVNLQNQLRLLLGYAPFANISRLRIVGGPVVNLLITEYYNPAEQRVTSTLVTDRTLILDTGNSTIRALGWVGYSVGIRF